MYLPTRVILATALLSLALSSGMVRASESESESASEAPVSDVAAQAGLDPAARIAALRAEDRRIRETIESLALGVNGPATADERARLMQRRTELAEERARLQFLRAEPPPFRSEDGRVSVFFGPTRPGNPDGARQQMLDLLARAKERVDFAFFEFDLPDLTDALLDARARGVVVRGVVDDRRPIPEVERLRAGGIQVRGDGRGQKTSLFMHNKFIVVDGRWVWAGSTNATDAAAHSQDNNAILMDSRELATEYGREFHEMFVDGLFGPRSPQNTSHEPIPVGEGRSVRVYFAPEDDVEAAMVEAIGQAQERIRILSFSFTAPAIAEALAEATRRGVVVEAVFEGLFRTHPGTRASQIADAGAHVRWDRNPSFMHNKLMIIDGRQVLTGSYNYSAGAATANDENVMFVQARDVARAYDEEFVRIWEVSEPDATRASEGPRPEDLAGAPQGGLLGPGILERLATAIPVRGIETRGGRE